jgi:hypothetical protein
MSYERDIVRILRVAHSWLTPCPADGKYCTNCEAAREIETLRAQVEELKALKPWALYGIWEKSFEDSEAGELARNLWLELTTEDMEGRS